MAEAMRAAWLLQVEYGLETRVVNVHVVMARELAPCVNAIHCAQCNAVNSAERGRKGCADALRRNLRRLRLSLYGTLGRLSRGVEPHLP